MTPVPRDDPLNEATSGIRQGDAFVTSDLIQISYSTTVGYFIRRNESLVVYK